MKQGFAILVVLLIGVIIALKLGLFDSGLSLDSITPNSARAGELIQLTGNGLDGDPQRTMVFFNERSVAAEATFPGGLSVRVPADARSGLVSVIVGDQTSNELFFKVAEGSALPADHPPVMQQQGMKGMMGGSSLQQAAPEGGSAEPTASPSAHEFYDPKQAKDFKDFTLPDKDGNPVKLSDHLGKIILLNFWATWCKPCLEEVPSLERLTKRAETMGLSVLAVSVDSSFEDIQKALPNVGLNILLDKDKKVATEYGTIKFPETWVIDKQGKIVARFIGSRNWDSATFVNFFSIMQKNGTLPAGMGQSAQEQ